MLLQKTKSKLEMYAMLFEEKCLYCENHNYRNRETKLLLFKFQETSRFYQSIVTTEIQRFLRFRDFLIVINTFFIIITVLDAV